MTRTKRSPADNVSLSCLCDTQVKTSMGPWKKGVKMLRKARAACEDTG